MVSCTSRPTNIAETDELLTPDQRTLLEAADQETDRSWGSRDEPPRSDPGAPLILIDKPTLGMPNRNPLAVKLRFVPQPGSQVDPTSFQMWLISPLKDFEVTEKVKQYLTISPSGAAADALPSIPTGKRTFRIAISDSEKRTARSVIELVIVDK